MSKKKLSDKEKLEKQKAEIAEKEAKLLEEDRENCLNELNQVLKKYNLGLGTRFVLDRVKDSQ